MCPPRRRECLPGMCACVGGGASMCVYVCVTTCTGV